MIKGLHPNLIEVRIDNRKYGTILRKLVMNGVHTTESPVTRREGKKDLGFVPLYSLGVTVLHQGQEDKFSPGQNNSAPLVPRSQVLLSCITLLAKFFHR